MRGLTTGAARRGRRRAAPGGSDQRGASDRGSVLMLVPAAVLIVLVMASIAVDMSLVHLRQRQAHDLAADLVGAPEVTVTPDGVEVSVALEADYIFAGVVPGAPDGRTVRARASAAAPTPP